MKDVGLVVDAKAEPREKVQPPQQERRIFSMGKQTGQ